MCGLFSSRLAAGTVVLFLVSTIGCTGTPVQVLSEGWTAPAPVKSSTQSMGRRTVTQERLHEDKSAASDGVSRSIAASCHLLNETFCDPWGVVADSDAAFIRSEASDIESGRGKYTVSKCPSPSNASHAYMMHAAVSRNERATSIMAYSKEVLKRWKAENYTICDEGIVIVVDVGRKAVAVTAGDGVLNRLNITQVEEVREDMVDILNQWGNRRVSHAILYAMDEFAPKADPTFWDNVRRSWPAVWLRKIFTGLAWGFSHPITFLGGFLTGVFFLYSIIFFLVALYLGLATFLVSLLRFLPRSVEDRLPFGLVRMWRRLHELQHRPDMPESVLPGTSRVSSDRRRRYVRSYVDALPRVDTTEFGRTDSNIFAEKNCAICLERFMPPTPASSTDLGTSVPAPSAPEPQNLPETQDSETNIITEEHLSAALREVLVGTPTERTPLVSNTAAEVEDNTSDTDNDVRALPCGHVFHKECIFQHLTSFGPGSTECPICKAGINWRPT